MSALQAFEEKLLVSWPPAAWQDVGVVVAVSGGADSVALLRALAAIKTHGAGRMSVAHFNHGLRSEAATDEKFVAELAEKLGLPCDVGRGDVAALAGLQGDGIEAAARHVRYTFLREAAEKLGARYVATAHTADDQAETVLHRILRGTGLPGLAGIRRVRPLGPAVTVIRPLLQVRRDEVLEYLRAVDQPCRQDESNTDRRFTRNRIRHELLPMLAQGYNARVIDALLRLSRLAGEADGVLQRLAEQLGSQCVHKTDDGGLAVDCRPLASADPYLVRELLKEAWRERHWPLQDMGHDQWQLLAEMARLPGSARRQIMFPGGILATREGETLRLRRTVN